MKQLSLYERLVLVNQYRILELLDPESGGKYRDARIVFEDGFELFYEESAAIGTDPLTINECKEVRDILNMYRIMQYSYRELDASEQEDISKQDIEFIGFDGQEDHRYLSFAEFYINVQGKFKEHKRKDLASHTMVLGMYRRMLKAWEEADDKYHLSKQDINRIIKAQSHSPSEPS